MAGVGARLDLRGPRPAGERQPIVSLTPDWVERLLERIGVTSVDQLPVPFSALTLGNIQRILRENLFFPDVLIQQVLAALRSGKHVMLTGAPGTGKTSPALVVANAASHAGLAEEPLLTTATAGLDIGRALSAPTASRGRRRFEFEAATSSRSHGKAMAGDRRTQPVRHRQGDRPTVHGALGPVSRSSLQRRRGKGRASISIVPWGASVPEGTSPRQVG